jgi:hypothetical protein
VESRAEAVLAHADELELRDADVAARSDVVARLLGRVDAVRARATLVRARLAEIPGDRDAIEGTEAEAEQREDEARAELAAAERRAEEVARSRRAAEEAQTHAAREVARACEALDDAGRRRKSLQARRVELTDEQRALEAEAEDLGVSAALASADIQRLPQVSGSGRSAPGPSLAELDEWGARAHAALFVVRGRLEAERELVVTEAALLGTTVLGEDVAGSSVALVRTRLYGKLASPGRRSSEPPLRQPGGSR